MNHIAKEIPQPRPLKSFLMVALEQMICSLALASVLWNKQMLAYDAGIHLHAGQVADCHFIPACVLYNFRTQVATLDCTKILLIALTIRRVLV